ncbi:ribosome small subunit-dependent GTPase A [bacterium]|nr:ribosome small subunit-dependent GTPase A [bacterium]
MSSRQSTGTGVPEPQRPALTPYGWDGQVAETYEPFNDPSRMPARVTRVERGGCLIATEVGEMLCRPAHGRLLSGSTDGPPVTGDWLAVTDEPGYGLVVAAILPRRTSIERLNARATGSQTLAANIDIVFIVHGLDRPVRPGLIERMLLVAFDSGARPVIVLTKADLVSDDGDGLTTALEQIESAASGVEVIVVSNETGSGVVDLVPMMAGSTVALIGESGVGKSSLANSLLGEERMATAATRVIDGKGRHTTSARELAPLPTGGVLIDTPGLRALGLADTSSGLAPTFTDVEDLAAGCRFRDCAHSGEPGCAVETAIAAGDLDQRRLDSYRRMEQELANEEKRADQRSRRAEERAVGKSLYEARRELKRQDEDRGR